MLPSTTLSAATERDKICLYYVMRKDFTQRVLILTVLDAVAPLSSAASQLSSVPSNSSRSEDLPAKAGEVGRSTTAAALTT